MAEEIVWGLLQRGAAESPVEAFDWSRMIWATEHTDWWYLLEIAFRTGVIFLLLIAGLRFLGRRSVSQLSTFELAIIIGMTSAAGDAMFYPKVPMLFGLVVIAVIAVVYRVVVTLLAHNSKVDRVLVGSSQNLFPDRRIDYRQLQRARLATEELMSLLRQKHVSHLGQVSALYLENSGALSVYYASAAETQMGLSILPEDLQRAVARVAETGPYACHRCAQVEVLQAGSGAICSHCQSREWSMVRSEPRIT